MEEIWKDIEGFEGLYQVSDLGRIKSLPKQFTMPNGSLKITKERILKPSTKHNNYKSIVFGSKSKRYQLQRVVAKAFPEICGEWFEGCTVDHLNTLCDDNRAVNLRVCTRKENQNNPLTLKHLKDASLKKDYNEIINKVTESNQIKVCQYDLSGNLINIYNSLKDAEKTIQCNGVSSVLNGKTFQCGGYVWTKYDDEHRNKIKISIPNKYKIIQQFDSEDNLIKEFSSIKEAINYYGYSNNNSINLCCKGKLNKAFGYKWKYK